MAEIINNSQKRIEILADFSRRLIEGENGRMLIEKHQQIINTVTPAETMQVLDKLLSEGLPDEICQNQCWQDNKCFLQIAL